METVSRFIQGVFPFQGTGLNRPQPLAAELAYSVPFDKRAQPIYLRAGNSCDELVYVLVTRDGKPMRYFPIGAKADVHVPLAVVEDLLPETKVEVLFAAPEGATGIIVLDIGIMEI